MKRICTASCLTALTLGLAAAPAAAGGILPIASPSFGTSCGNHGASHASGTTTHGTGAVNGNFAGLPIGDPFSHCGGAELGGLGGLVGGLGGLTGQQQPIPISD